MTKSTTPTTKAPAQPRAKATPKAAVAKKTAAPPGVIRRNAMPIAGALVAGAAAAAALFFTRGPNALAQGHPAPDLETGEHPGPKDRADPHFRPDMDAPMTPEDRAALAPALGRSSLVG